MSTASASPQRFPPRSELRVIPQALGWVFGVGASIALASLAVTPHSADARLHIGMYVAVAYLITLAIWVGGNQLPRFILEVMGIGGTAATLAAIITASDTESDGILGLLHINAVTTVGMFVLVGVLLQLLITQARRRVSDLNTLALTDSLTDIANRRSWDEEIARELTRAKRDGYPVCVAMLDLDRFKSYNDSRGHQAGDDFLTRSAKAWTLELRESDFISRYGGEEFAVLLRNCSVDEAIAVIERLRGAVPDGETCSAGVARWDGQESSVSVIRRADDALYEAKAAGRNRIRIAEGESAATDTVLTSKWAGVVREVLAHREIHIAYQPIVSLADRVVVGFEALARPSHESAELSVERMFAVAHRIGLGRDLDWVCREAALRGAQELDHDVPLFINVSVSTLLDPHFGVDRVLALLLTEKRSPQDVVLEITEREIVHDLQRFRTMLEAYREHGFTFALDDVGEGHATLDVLAASTPEYIKIARSLVIAAAKRGSQAAICAVVAFAESCGAQVIAEGIESQHAVEAMEKLGVLLGQGFHLGRPTWVLSKEGAVLRSAEL